MTIIELDSINSTNKYAMQLIDADKAQHGLTITAKSQTEGKGQRGKSWIDKPGQSLLMSLIVMPILPLREQVAFNATIAVAIANVLQKVNDHWRVHIKWPNDIIVNDKKAGGLLIENVLRGNSWIYSVIGLGLNIKQDCFPEELPFATSLKIASGIDHEVSEIRGQIVNSILSALKDYVSGEKAMYDYNEFLYKRNQQQAFSDQEGVWSAELLHVNPDGTLAVRLQDGGIAQYYHGQVLWAWGK